MPIVLRIERRLRDGCGPDLNGRPMGGTSQHYWRGRTAEFSNRVRKSTLARSGQSFEALGLKTYTSNEDHIADLLNEAWKNFQSHPESFAQWENFQIEELRRKFGPVA